MKMTKKEHELYSIISELGATYASEVSRILAWFQSQATTYLRRLEQKGFIKQVDGQETPEQLKYIQKCTSRNSKNLRRFKTKFLKDVVTMFVKSEIKNGGEEREVKRDIPEHREKSEPERDRICSGRD